MKTKITSEASVVLFALLGTQIVTAGFAIARLALDESSCYFRRCVRPTIPWRSRNRIAVSTRHSRLFVTSECEDVNRETRQAQEPGHALFRHSEIVWKIKPSPETPWLYRLRIRISAKLLRWDARRKGVTPPLILCPKTPNQRILLEAFAKTGADKLQKAARFGISAQAGPAIPPLQKTVSELYYHNRPDAAPVAGVRTAAIVYMFVEPDYRQRDLGRLALQVIALIHAVQGCDFTVLVADDKGSGKLVEWYERHGFRRAPQLQDAFGSPGGKFGIAMIAPTNGTVPNGCTIEWW
jgi:GNAT superfamily N-acetyltransferase